MVGRMFSHGTSQLSYFDFFFVVSLQAGKQDLIKMTQIYKTQFFLGSLAAVKKEAEQRPTTERKVDEVGKQKTLRNRNHESARVDKQKCFPPGQ